MLELKQWGVSSGRQFFLDWEAKLNRSLASNATRTEKLQATLAYKKLNELPFSEYSKLLGHERTKFEKSKRLFEKRRYQKGKELIRKSKSWQVKNT